MPSPWMMFLATVCAGLLMLRIRLIDRALFGRHGVFARVVLRLIRHRRSTKVQWSSKPYWSNFSVRAILGDDARLSGRRPGLRPVCWIWSVQAKLQ
jgi:hypothetical protein